jgi:hypothetical protein
MSEQEASRTLVKSPPELWAECSDARSLSRHLGDAVGEIRIKRLEPETTVAWEGEHVSGTVRLEPSGWGTKVTLTAAGEAQAAVEVPESGHVAASEPPAPGLPAPAAPEPPAPEPPAPEPPAPPRAGLVARFRRWFASGPAEPPSAAQAEPPPAAEALAPPLPEPEPKPVAEAETPANELDLAAALDSLGKAHHRPFSRA